MLLPIWVAAWEFECCQPDAVIGERWQASLFLLPVEPWWAEQGTALSDAELELGVVSLDAQILRAAPDPDAAALVAAGPLRVGVVGMAGHSGQLHLRGRLNFEGHIGPDGVELGEVRNNGTVRRVRRVPLVRDLRDGAWVPVRQLEPEDVQSTAEHTTPTLLSSGTTGSLTIS